MAADSTTTGGSGPPSAQTGGRTTFKFNGMTFTVTARNEIAQVVKGGALRVMGSESFLDADAGTREHFVDVQGRTEAVLLLVSVREDERRIVGIQRF